MPDVTAELVDHILTTDPTDRVRVVGIAEVGVGKSSWADQLVDAMRHRGARAVVVSSDSFLHPNAELDRLGLTLAKGTPASFNVDALVSFVSAARGGALPLEVPIHSHVTYDIGGHRTVPAADVVILDGLNVLQPAIRPLLDVAIYLHADLADNRRWFLDRFRRLREAARSDPSSFYAQFATMSDTQSAAVAEWTWDEMNLPNLLDHISPTRRSADIVVLAGPDHSLSFIRSSLLDPEPDPEPDPGPGRDSGS